MFDDPFVLWCCVLPIVAAALAALLTGGSLSRKRVK